MSSPQPLPVLLNILALLLGYLLAIWGWIKTCRCFQLCGARKTAITSKEEADEEEDGDSLTDALARGQSKRRLVIKYLSSSGAVECRLNLAENAEERKAFLRNWSVRNTLSRSSEEGRVIHLPSKTSEGVTNCKTVLVTAGSPKLRMFFTALAWPAAINYRQSFGFE